MLPPCMYTAALAASRHTMPLYSSSPKSLVLAALSIHGFLESRKRYEPCRCVTSTQKHLHSHQGFPGEPLRTHVVVGTQQSNRSMHHMDVSAAALAPRKPILNETTSRKSLVPCVSQPRAEVAHHTTMSSKPSFSNTTSRCAPASRSTTAPPAAPPRSVNAQQQSYALLGSPNYYL